jgi:hypothetical protein
MRVFSYNRLSYADRIKWLSINPYIGNYAVFYSNSVLGDERLRLAPEAGVSLSTKLYKFYDTDLNLFGKNIDALRHVITPEVVYGYLRDPTVTNSSVFQFDTTDDLSRSEKITFTLNNKLQARNEEKTWDFLYFSPSVEYLIHPEGSASRFNKVTADLEIYPKEGISLGADTEYDVNTRRVTSFNADITFTGKVKVIEGGEEIEKEKYAISYGQRYTRQSSTQGTLDFSYQLTPKLQFMAYVRNEYNTGDFEEQRYTIRTDLHCWWMDIGLKYERLEEGSKDCSVWVMFTLKAFPEAAIELDYDREGAKKSY